MNPLKGRMLLLGGLVGVAYGLLAYTVFTHAGSAWESGRGAAASLSYLVLVPIALGAVPLLFSEADQIHNFRDAFFIPWVSMFGMFLVVALAELEGALCFLVLVAPFVLFVSFTIWLVRALGLRRLKKARRKAAGLMLLLLPFATARLEQRWLARAEINVVESAVTVQAAPADVWRQIVEVAPIDARELPSSWLNRLGVPRPVSASVDAARVGGVRTGVFEGGLRFVEAILAFEPERRLRLDVAVDPSSIGDAPSLRHVFSGAYVSLSTVEYRVQAIPGGGTRLSLACQYLLRSSVNPYGRLWMGTILRDFETRLLAVVRARAEHGAQVKTPPESPIAAQRE